jgi:hypothetical protein
MARKAVLKIKQCAGNSHRWVLSLACGHEVTITTNARPTKRPVRCLKCQGAS